MQKDKQTTKLVFGQQTPPASNLAKDILLLRNHMNPGRSGTLPPIHIDLPLLLVSVHRIPLPPG